MGKRSRITFPLTWGGTKRAAIDLEKRMERGPFSRLTAGGSISRRANLAFQQDDDRARVFVHGEREVSRALRLAGTGGWQRASFEGVADQFAQVGGDVVFDTRVECGLRARGVGASEVRRRAARAADRTRALRRLPGVGESNGARRSWVP